MTITEAFDLPRAEDIWAMAFVVKLRELDPNAEAVEHLARERQIWSGAALRGALGPCSSRHSYSR